MNPNIQIVEKPDWVSWNEIHEIVWKAHEINREQGVFMRYPTLPGEEIRKRIEGKGKMLVAIKDGRVVGTSGFFVKEMSLWCGKGRYAYFCFDSVLPEMRGTGIYRQLNLKREELALACGLDKLTLDTNEGNSREIEVVRKAGFKPVSMKKYENHFNVVFVKWLDGCPYSDLRCKFEFSKQKVLTKTKRILRQVVLRK